VGESELRNDEIGHLLLAASTREEGHRRLALERAAKAAWTWPVEASDAAASDSLTSLASVGPWVAQRIEAWLQDPPPIPEPDETRRDFLTFARARAALDADPTWQGDRHGDLQMHTTDSDGRLPLAEMVEAAREAGRAYVSITDHSASLKIAHGMDAAQLADQARRIARLNASFEREGSTFRVLRSMEVDVFDDGSADMTSEVLAELDVVLGAFHSKLRSSGDSTPRYLAALANPSVHILGHPTTRMFDRRGGLVADWRRVFAEAARRGKAIELDGTPRRNDLPVPLAELALSEGVEWFSMGSDAHDATELGFLEMAMATAAIVGIPRERILNYQTPAEVAAWAGSLSERAAAPGW
jgi:putative hydrolase